MYKKILKSLNIVQEASNEERNKKGLKRLGRGYLKAYRFNPYNPISYALVAIAFLLTLLMYGVCGFYERFYNPFKWD